MNHMWYIIREGSIYRIKAAWTEWKPNAVIAQICGCCLSCFLDESILSSRFLFTTSLLRLSPPPSDRGASTALFNMISESLLVLSSPPSPPLEQLQIPTDFSAPHFLLLPTSSCWMLGSSLWRHCHEAPSLPPQAVQVCGFNDVTFSLWLV